MEEEKDEIPEGFIDAVKFVCDNAEVVLDILNRLIEDYLLGKDIRESLRLLKDRHRNVFMLIYDILNKDKNAMKLLC
ncbi:MAG: hypothetical protein DRP01_02705 [Archaeoglobales archaeon]|nr:MAG: hypothetical protein DRP01_02705 [Archaeoglobales archaeon]